MNWQCLLYGHQWRHPGRYEVVLTREGGPSHPFRCALCGDEMVMRAGDGRR